MYKLNDNPARNVANSELYDPRVTNRTTNGEHIRSFEQKAVFRQ
jgi:hypothetical protein